jgi:hypothetical protein
MSILSQPAPRRRVRTACMQSLQPVRAWTGHTAPPRLFDIVLIIDINKHVNCRCWWILKGLQQEVLAVTPSGLTPSGDMIFMLKKPCRGRASQEADSACSS